MNRNFWKITVSRPSTAPCGGVNRLSAPMSSLLLILVIIEKDSLVQLDSCTKKIVKNLARLYSSSQLDTLRSKKTTSGSHIASLEEEQQCEADDDDGA